METMAEPGRAYLTEHTAQLVKGWFGLDDLGPKTVKGARQPLGVYVLGRPFPSWVTARAASTAAGGSGTKLAAMEDALAGAIDGRFQVVGVVGEPGMGRADGGFDLRSQPPLRLCHDLRCAIASLTPIASSVAWIVLARRPTGVTSPFGRVVGDLCQCPRLIALTGCRCSRASQA